MIFDRLLQLGKRERQVTREIRRHIELLCQACDTFRNGLEKQDRNLMLEVNDLERDADQLRRRIVAMLYEGAFLPYIRPDLCKFVEIVDEIFDRLEDTVSYYLEMVPPEPLRDEFVRVAFLNFRMCEMLLICFDAMLEGEDLGEKTLAIRIYEKKIDDIKFQLIHEARQFDVDFWQGRMLSDFIVALTAVSDIIEDASDHLQVISVITR